MNENKNMKMITSEDIKTEVALTKQLVGQIKKAAERFENKLDNHINDALIIKEDVNSMKQVLGMPGTPVANGLINRIKNLS